MRKHQAQNGRLTLEEAFQIANAKLFTGAEEEKNMSFFSLCMTQITEAVPNGAILF